MKTLFDFLTDPATGMICLAYGALQVWAYFPQWKRWLRERRRREAWAREPFRNA